MSRFLVSEQTWNKNALKRKIDCRDPREAYSPLFTCWFDTYIYTNVGRVCSIRRRHQRPSSTSLYLGKGGCLLTCSLILKTLGLSMAAVLCDVTMTSRDRIQIRPFNIYYWQLEFAITYQMYRLFRRISFSRYIFQINSRESNSKYSAKIYMSHLQNLIYIISMVFHLYRITRC